MSEIQLNTIEEAIEDFREGKFLIVVDDEDRENEGDFIIAAEKVTPEKINFMLKNGRGVLCAPITEERCQELELDMQVANNTSLLGTPFTITVDKLGGKCHDRRFHVRPCGNDLGAGRSKDQAIRSGTSRTYQSAPCPLSWRTSPCGSYRGCRGFGPVSRFISRRSLDRDHQTRMEPWHVCRN